MDIYFLWNSNRDRGRALVGAHRKDSAINGAEYTSVVKRVPHPDYDPTEFTNDFMVIQLGGWVSLRFR